IGVSSRVAELADRTPDIFPADHVPFKSIVPLQDIIAESVGVSSTGGKKVQEMYESLIVNVGNEFHILLDAELDIIASVANGRVAEAVRRVRSGELSIEPGYDGLFGKVKIFGDEKIKK
ncbi:MAG: endonuclease Q family protein, partial [Candidatus Uhrbacteria bacterium]|nr:endonuclease Q family protein [Candidatus Uhrbacteria bacterium]